MLTEIHWQTFSLPRNDRHSFSGNSHCSGPTTGFSCTLPRCLDLPLALHQKQYYSFRSICCLYCCDERGALLQLQPGESCVHLLLFTLLNATRSRSQALCHGLWSPRIATLLPSWYHEVMDHDTVAPLVKSPRIHLALFLSFPALEFPSIST